MKSRKARIRWMLLTVTMTVVPVGIAAEPEVGEAAQPKSAEAAQPRLSIPASAATIERIMDQAVQNIARRYNLSETQAKKTDELMKREVSRFLREHEDEVWPVIRDLLISQFGAKPPQDRNEVMRIGKAARPLTELAKEAIYRANEEWRLILTPAQKETHDFDLAEMDKTFKDIDKRFAGWENGKPTEGGIFPEPDPRLAERSPERPQKPPELPPEIGWIDIGMFDTFVEQFIKDNKLDEGQIDSARSILKEFKEKAMVFTTTNRVEFAKIMAAQTQAIQNRDRDKTTKAEALRKKLLEPINKLFGKMEERLKSLLNSAQLERYAKNNGAEPKREASTVKKKPSPKKTKPQEAAATKTSDEKTTTPEARADAEKESG